MAAYGYGYAAHPMAAQDVPRFGGAGYYMPAPHPYAAAAPAPVARYGGAGVTYDIYTPPPMDESRVGGARTKKSHTAKAKSPRHAPKKTRKHAVRHIGQASQSSSLTKSKVPKFAYHAWHTTFTPILAGKKKASQMVVHAPTAYAAAKKVTSRLNRASRRGSHEFLLTQQVKLPAGKHGEPQTGTRVYQYRGVFHNSPEVIQRGNRQIRIKGVSVVKSMPIGPQKRVMVPYTRHEDVKRAVVLIATKRVMPQRFVAAHKDRKLHKRLRERHGLVHKRKSPKTHKAGGAAAAGGDFYDVEPRYGGAAPMPPMHPVDPYYYGVDPRVAGAYGFH